jgi:hypothetical protein
MNNDTKMKNNGAAGKPARRKRFTPPPAEAFDNQQLDLFRSVLANTAEERDALSNAVDLWDNIPRYPVSRVHMNKLRTADGFLPPREVPFMFRGQEFIALIQAASVKTEDGKWISYYPSAREELIEHALRKLALEQQNGFFDQAGYRSGVRFSLWQLRQELIEQGHELRYDELVAGLQILAKSSIEIIANRSEGLGEVTEHFAISPFLSALAGVKRADYDADRSLRWTAQFHPLVTYSVDQITYRQFNYERLMKCSSQLARWLLCQLVLKYVQASMLSHFEMRFSTIRRDSALLDGYGRQRAAIEALDSAWNELKEQGALSNIKKVERRGLRNRIEDVIYTLTPSLDFVAEQKAANRRQANAKAIGAGR